MLDPKHHYIFADEWPRLTFSKLVPMSETWIYGRRPFMTGHNQRPTYELAKRTGVRQRVRHAARSRRLRQGAAAGAVSRCRRDAGS